MKHLTHSAFDFSEVRQKEAGGWAFTVADARTAKILERLVERLRPEGVMAGRKVSVTFGF